MTGAAAEVEVAAVLIKIMLEEGEGSGGNIQVSANRVFTRSNRIKGLRTIGNDARTLLAGAFAPLIRGDILQGGFDMLFSADKIKAQWNVKC